MRDGDRLNEVLALDIPAIVIGHKRKEVSGVVNVVTDSPQIGRLGAEHLIQCGFKHFAFVSVTSQPNEIATWAQAREENFVRRVRAAGFETQTYLLPWTTGRNWVRERNALVNWLKCLL